MVKGSKSIYDNLKSGIKSQGENLFPLRGCYSHYSNGHNWKEQIPDIDWKKVIKFMEEIPYVSE